MRIGILTLQYGHNYGGILQCYALQSFLESLGHNVQVINYIPSKKLSIIQRVGAKFKTINSFSDLMHNIIDFSKVKKKANKITPNNIDILRNIFDDFRERRLNMSPLVDENSILSLKNQYDIVVVGSDQVWTNLYGERKIYFLDWLGDEYKGKRIAYAACSAHNSVKGKTRHILGNLLSKMDAIGVRDTTTEYMVKSADNTLHTTLVADPTLLHDFSEFENEEVPKTPYILTYLLGTEIKGGHKEALKKIKDVVGDIPIISLILPQRPSGIEPLSDEIIIDATPENWVTLIRNAEVVYTDSFHGIMFSLKYKKKFFAYYENAIRSSRLKDLKERFPDLPIYKDVPKKLTLTYEWKGDEFLLLSKFFLKSNI